MKDDVPGFVLHKKPAEVTSTESELDGLKLTNKGNVCVLDGNKSGYWFAIGQKIEHVLGEGVKLLGPRMVSEVTLVELYVEQVGSEKGERKMGADADGDGRLLLT